MFSFFEIKNIFLLTFFIEENTENLLWIYWKVVYVCVLFKGITNFECKRVVFCYCISLQRKAFSILHTLTLFIFYPIRVFFSPSSLHPRTYCTFQYIFGFNFILYVRQYWWIVSDGGYMKLDLLTFHSQPQLNRMVLFLRSFWEYLFSVKRKKISNEKSIDVECCLVVFCL